MRRRAGTLVCLGLLAAACARMVAPGGGPVDDVPPELLAVDPEPSAELPGLQRVELAWSERLEAASVTVSLYPPREHRLSVRAERVVVTLEEPLGPGVLVMHVPASVSDRRGNRVAAPVDLAWSGLDSLPEGALQLDLGRQGGGSVSGETLVELRSTGPGGDTTLVRRTTPDTTGAVSLYWLLPGEYGVLAYEDEDGSLDRDPEREAGADTALSLAPGDTLTLSMTLTVVDTLGPRIIQAVAEDAYHVRATLSEEVSWTALDRGVVCIRDTSGAGLPVRGHWLTSGLTGSSFVTETGAPMEGGLSYTLCMEGVSDLLGNPSRPDSTDFPGSDTLPADSLRVRSYYPAPGTQGVDPGGPYDISFTHWVHRDSLASRLTLLRLADSTAVEGSIERLSGRSFSFVPVHQLLGEQQHRFTLAPGLHTPWGDTMETALQWAFIPAWGDEPGAVEGSVTGTGAPAVVLQVSRTGGEAEDRTEYFTVAPGAYRVDDLPAGRYTVAAFLDRDGDGGWSPDEPYGTHPGVVLVQPGITTEGVDVHVLP